MRTVLVVDDETGVLVLAQQLLQAASFDVYTAGDAEEALALLSTRPFDVLVVDVHLPDQDGLDLLQRAREQQPEIAVVVMTGYKNVDTLLRAVRLGVDEIVIKPNEVDAGLPGVIQRALANARKNHPVVDLTTLPVILRGTGFSLTEVSSAAAEKQIVQALVDAFQASQAGVYQREPPAKTYRLLAQLGPLPGGADEFWQQPEVARAFAEDTAVLLAEPQFKTAQASYWERLGWSSVLAVSIRGKTSEYLFLAARAVPAPVFQADHLTLLKLFARQAVFALENARLWGRLSRLVQKMERSGGLLPGAARMAALDHLLPPALAEVNNPLQSLKSNLYLATRRDLSPERAANGLVLAQKDLYRLEGSFQRLLTLVQPAEAERAPIDLEGIAGRMVEAFQPIFREHGIQARLTAARPLPQVLTARGALEQILGFILLNSVEALASNSTEKIIYIDIENSPDGPLLAVEDTGPGLMGNDPDLIFKPFYTTRPDHAGLGLAVSRQLLEHQGGRLTLGKPAHGSGARFEVRFPSAA